jgi:RES domain-containing protein
LNTAFFDRLSAVLQKYPANNGKGAALTGARCNPVGVEVIHTAPMLALATLEIIVHLAALPKDFVFTEIRVSDYVSIEHVADAQLPRGWNALTPTPKSSQRFRAQWVRERRSCVLSVPSSIVPIERNCLLNPAHPEFAAIEFLAPRPFSFDPRLKK